MGKQHQVSDLKETTRYDYIISWLKCFKGCPGSESKSLTHPLRLWHHLAAHGSDFTVNHSTSLHPTPGTLFSLCLKAGFCCLPACLPAAPPTLNKNRGRFPTSPPAGHTHDSGAHLSILPQEDLRKVFPEPRQVRFPGHVFSLIVQLHCLSFSPQIDHCLCPSFLPSRVSSPPWYLRTEQNIWHRLSPDKCVLISSSPRHS